MRLLVLTFGLLLAILISFSAVRMWADGQVYTPFKTNYFRPEEANNKEKIQIVPWEQNYLLEKKPELVLWVDIYRTTKGEILAKPWKDKNTLKKDLPQEANPSRPLLLDLLKQFPKARWVINCDDNTQDIQVTLNSVLAEAQMQDLILVQSNYNTILESLKETQPMLVYGSTIADITRLKTFQSMALISASPFKGDVFFAPLTYLDRPAVNEEIVTEMHRRFKKVIIGPLMNAQDLEQAQKLGADGFFLADPFLLEHRK